jgi:hypothetical protein
MGFRISRGKTIILGVSGGIPRISEWLDGLGARDRGLCQIWEFFRDFSGILEGLRPICN